MGPQSIVEVQVWKDVVPPSMVSGRLVLPLLANPMEGILGDLQNFSSVFLSRRNKERNYLDHRQVMSPPRRRGILFIAESSNITQEPTSGQRDRWTGPLPEGRSLDDWMLEQRHRWNSVLTEMGQGELMGSIRCTRIPFILVVISQSHLSPLSVLLSQPTPRSEDPLWHRYGCIVSLS